MKEKKEEHTKLTTEELLQKSMDAMTPDQKVLFEDLKLNMKKSSGMAFEAERSDAGRDPSHYTTFYKLGYFREERNLRLFLKTNHPEFLQWAESFMEKVFDVLPKDQARLDLACENYLEDYGPNGSVREPDKYLDMGMVKERLKTYYNYTGDVCFESRVLNLMDKVYKQQQLEEKKVDMEH